MVRVSKPAEVKTKVITKNGECQVVISLDLNININVEDLKKLGIGTVAAQDKQEDENVNWAIPEFGNQEKIKFGKTEK
jgi:hypothetical protein